MSDCKTPTFTLYLLSGFVFFVALAPSSRAAVRDEYQYLSPVPDSRNVSPANNIAIRYGDPIDRKTLEPGVLIVSGSSSGEILGDLGTSDDQRTIIFRPDHPYHLGEHVTVNLRHGVKTQDSKALPAFQFRFSVAHSEPRAAPARPHEWISPDVVATDPTKGKADVATAPTVPDLFPCDQLPAGYPQITNFYSTKTGSGGVFLSPFSQGQPDLLALIVDDHGVPLYFERFVGNGPGFDFKRQPNGLLTAFNLVPGMYGALDSTYALVDSFEAGNGYITDLHGIQLLPNGNALLHIYDFLPMPMDTIVPGGDPNAFVVGFILQELDPSKNVIFQWRSWDHFDILDGEVSPNSGLPDSSNVDYCHVNSIEVDLDGNLLISSRHMNEITKIDRQTGDIIWRLGANAKNNDFTFINDPRGFSHQHDARRLPNGNLTLFDNGNYLNPLYSRAVEYELDEVNMTATLVWEKRLDPEVYGDFMGSVQRLGNGRTMIGWGGTFENRKITEFDTTDSLTFGLGLSNFTWTYRAFRFPWQTSRFVTDVDTLDFGVVEGDQSPSLPFEVRNNLDTELTIDCVASTEPQISIPGFAPFTLQPGETQELLLQFQPTHISEVRGNVYLREADTSRVVLRSVAVRGIAVPSTDAQIDPLPTRFALRSFVPNPIGKQASVRFDLPIPIEVDLKLYDARGRLVKTGHARKPLPAGTHQWTWDRTDNVGRSVTAGVYYLKFNAGSFAATKRVVVLK